MKLLSIDPGCTESAWVLYDTETRRPIQHMKETNESLIRRIRNQDTLFLKQPGDGVIENVACYGMAVGKEVFETCIWIGRFMEAWRDWHGPLPQLIYRREIKLHLCNSVKAKDSNVRQVLIDLYGGKSKALGLKASPGPLYGISDDRWSALAIAVTFADTKLILSPDAGGEGAK